MTGVMQTIQRFWMERSQREQMMLAVMGVLAGLVLLQILVISPLLDTHQRAREDYAASMRMYRSMEADIQRYAEIRTGETSFSNASQPLRTVAGSVALGHGISIARMIPSDDGRLTVNIARAESQALMSWLIDLETRYGVEIISTSMDRESDAFVEANIVLRRRGG